MVRIALGYDGSPAARAALEWVGHRVTDAADQVDIVTVARVLASDTHTTQLLADAESRLREIAPSVEISTRAVDGTVPRTLVEDARAADLLVIGIRRDSPVRAALTGWRPLRLASRAHGPVCIVPDDWEASDLPILAGVDDDPSSDAALAAAAEEAHETNRSLHLVHAWSMPTPTLEGSVALIASPLEVKERHRKVLKEAATLVRAMRPDLEIVDELVATVPASALLHRAPHSSLLVLGTHRRGVLAGGFLGSVAQDVLGQTACPVMIVPNAG